MMLGAQCSACCGCACPEGQVLPKYVRATLSGFTNDSFFRTQHAPPTVEFSVPEGCLGSGAAATAVVQQGGPDDQGFPVVTVTLTNGGSNYAQIARVQPPTPTLSGGGTGAVFTPTLSEGVTDCGQAYWFIESVTVSGSGSGYGDNEHLAVKMPSPGKTGEGAVLTLTVAREEPEFDGITGNAEVEYTLTGFFDPGSFGDAWKVESVSITSGGSGYSDYQQLSPDEKSGTLASYPAMLFAVVGREPPIVTLAVPDSASSGSGVSLSAAFSETVDPEGRPAWQVASVSVADGGGGYSVGDAVVVIDVMGVEVTPFYATVATISQSGAVLSVNVEEPGQYYRSTGVLEDVIVQDGGAYYRGGAVAGVTVESGGQYWAEDPSLPPTVSPVSVTAGPCRLESGSPAELSAEVDTDTSSATFGNIVAVNIENGGNCYRKYTDLAFDCDATEYNGKEGILELSLGGDFPCRYCGCVFGAQVTATWASAVTPMVGTAHICGVQANFVANQNDLPYDCSPLEWNLEIALPPENATGAFFPGASMSLEEVQPPPPSGCGNLFRASSVTLSISGFVDHEQKFRNQNASYAISQLVIDAQQWHIPARAQYFFANGGGAVPGLADTGGIIRIPAHALIRQFEVEDINGTYEISGGYVGTCCRTKVFEYFSDNCSELGNLFPGRIVLWVPESGKARLQIYGMGVVKNGQATHVMVGTAPGYPGFAGLDCPEGVTTAESIRSVTRVPGLMVDVYSDQDCDGGGLPTFSSATFDTGALQGPTLNDQGYQGLDLGELIIEDETAAEVMTIQVTIDGFTPEEA